MSYKIINPGYACLMKYPQQLTQYTDDFAHSKTGVCFKQISGCVSRIDLPARDREDQPIYLRVDAYVPNDGTTAKFNFTAPYTTYSIITTISTSGITTETTYLRTVGTGANEVCTRTYATDGLQGGSVVSLLYCFGYVGGSWTRWELSVNGGPLDQWLASFAGSSDFRPTRTTAGQEFAFDADYVSNLIISNEEILPGEQIVALPVSATNTGMTAGANGIYVADAVDQMILQTPDVSNLITAHGAASSVTGVCVVGNPAYKAGNGLTHITAVEQSGSVVSAHNTFALSDDTLASVGDYWSPSNLTLGDLANMQFGWKMEA